MKKKLIIALSLLVVVAIAVGGTLAYFSMSTDEVTNVFTVGKNVKITLIDIFDPNSPVTPGADIKKEVGIENTADVGGTDVYAAITADFQYNAPVYYEGTTLLKYANIISQAEYDALDAATQANYQQIEDASSDYYNYWILKTAVAKTYWTIDESTTPPPETEVTDAAEIAAGHYNKTKATYDSGEAQYGAATQAKWEGTTAADTMFWNLVTLRYYNDVPELVDGINPDWEFVGNTADGKAVFVCKNALAPGEQSNAFDAVHIDEHATADTVFPFSITVKGYAAQTTGFTNAADAIEAAFDLLP